MSNYYLGSLPEQFAVDSDGSTNYSISIEIPPGTARLQPKLSIGYHSGAGNDVLGVGWRLLGLSEISRTKATIAQDNFHGTINYDANDRFALDGQRLIPVAGSSYNAADAVYHTEIESWQKIVPNYPNGDTSNGPQSFTLYMHDGTVLEYGSIAGSAVPASNNPNVYRTWSLCKTTDRNGNYMTFTYELDSADNDNYIVSIDYTANDAVGLKASHQIKFTYTSDRSDVVPQYQGGGVYQTSRLLQQIETSVSGNTALVYTFAYGQGNATGRHQLQSVTLGDSAENQLAPTQFTWSDNDQGIFQKPATAIPTGQGFAGSYFSVDLNGDGYVDLLNTYQVNGNLTLAAFISDGTTFTPVTPITTSAKFYSGAQIIPMDVNGDGCTDIVYVTQNGNYASLTIFTSVVTNGSWSVSEGAFGEGGPSDIPWGTFLASDVDGDGLCDLVCRHTVGPKLGLTTLFSNGSGFAPSSTDATNPIASSYPGAQLIPMDFNGTGTSDLVYVFQNGPNAEFVLYSSNGRNGFTEQLNIPVSSGSVPYVGAFLCSDVNGDGIDDIVQAYQDDGQLAIQVLSSNGRSFVANTVQKFTIGKIGSNLPMLLPMEVNGDGLPDLICLLQDGSSVSTTVLLSNGSGYTQASNVTQPTSVTVGSEPIILPTDFNGDGKTDMLIPTASLGDLSINPIPCLAGMPDQMVTITNGLSGSYSVTYKPLTDTSVYSPNGTAVDSSLEVRGVFSTRVNGSSFGIANSAPTQRTPGTAYATRRVDFPKYVVSSYTKNDGRGNSYQYNHTYASALMDMTGRGWLGFETVSAEDVSANATTVATYHQTFPYSHYVASTKLLRTSPPALLQASSLAYDDIENGPNTGAGIHQVLTTGATTDYFTYAAVTGNSTPDCTLVKASSNFDAFGNAQNISHTGNALTNEVYAFKTFSNDPTIWKIGFELGTKVTSDSAGSDVVTWSQATYDTNMNIAVSSAWADTNQGFLETKYGYDGCGNRTSITSPNGNVATMTFDPASMTFMATKTQLGANKVPLTLGYTYYPQNGEMHTYTDENGIIVTQAIDGLGRVTDKTGPNPSGGTSEATSQSYGSDSAGTYLRVTTLTDWDGTQSWTRKYYDGFSRVFLTATLSPDGTTTINQEQEFDSNNNVVVQSLPYVAGATPVYQKNQYDEYKRIISFQEPSPVDDGSTVTNTFDYQSTNTVVATVAAGTNQALSTTFTYGFNNGKQLLLRRTDSNGALTSYTYDAAGRQLTVTDPGGVVSTTIYDGLGTPTSYKSQNGATTLWSNTYTHDYVNRVETQQDAKSNKIVLNKDTLSRIVTKAVTSADLSRTDTTTYVYDDSNRKLSLNRLSSVSDSSGAQYLFDYDNYGNQTDIGLTVDGNTWSFSRTFKPTGELQTQTYPDGSVETREYGPGGLASDILLQDPANKFTSPIISNSLYNSFGKPTAIKYGNGTSESMGFTAGGLLKSQTVAGPSNTSLYAALLSKGPIGALGTATDQISNTQQTFTYDAQYRVATESGPANGTYHYDQAGNVQLKDGVTYASPGNQVLSGTSASTTFQAAFDGAGNMSSATRNGEATKYSYDGENRLVQAGVTTYLYDYAGRRIKKAVQGGPTVYSVSPSYQVTVFADGSKQHTKLIAGTYGALVSVTTVESGNPPAYRGIAAPGVFYNHPDRLTSTVCQTDASGAVVSTVVYDAYGVVQSITGSASIPAMYTGKEWDDSTGLYYFGARYYDPVLGRFLTADDRTGGPVAMRDVFNPYSFCLNDPVNNTDPVGHSIGGFVDHIGNSIAHGFDNFGHDIVHLVHNRVFQLVTSFVVDSAFIIAGGIALFLGANLLGTTLMSTGLMGMVYDVQVAATGKSFSWKEWGIQLAVGAATGLVAGAFASGASVLAVRLAGDAVDSAFAVGGFGRIGLNILAGAVGGAGGNVVGQAVSNAANGETGHKAAAGLGMAALSGFVIGGVGSAFGEAANRVFSHAPTWDESVEYWFKVHDDSPLPLRIAESGTNAKIWTFLPGFVGNWVGFGFSEDQAFKAKWIPSW
jgi:RHS repeat-associated protein